jgi:UDP-galactopyranose mutase
MFESCGAVVVGAGFFGATIAERIASQLLVPVAVLDRRDHIGGNAYSEFDPETGIEIHRYGSHIFHTSSEEVWQYLRQFTAFNEYRHRVLAVHRGRMFTMPINLMTVCNFYDRALTPDEARDLISAEVKASGISQPANLEEKSISLVGRPLYEAFIRGYTAKQWQLEPRLLPADIISRLPVRYSFNDRYFSDRYEGIPLDGYTKIFERMLANPLIAVHTKADFFEIRSQLPANMPVVFTGPIDRFFDYRAGLLRWRTIDLEREVVPTGDFQGTSVVNYVDTDVPFTRIHEPRHLHPERRYAAENATVIFREHSRAAGRDDDPYYPVGTAQDKLTYAAYREMARDEPAVIFGGRLGTYRYLDMHQAIGAALKAFTNEVAPRITGSATAREVGGNLGDEV